MHNNVLTTECCHSEFLSTYTCEAYCLPNLRHVSPLSCIKSSLVLLKLDVNLSKLLVVADALVQDFSSHEELIIEASVTTLLRVGLIGLRHKSLEVGQETLSILSISVDQLTIDALVLD